MTSHALVTPRLPAPGLPASGALTPGRPTRAAAPGRLAPLGSPRSIAAPRGHRSEIAALRLLAIVSVVVYHYWPTALPGGFVGVDVFFVISGFLITSHLVRELDETGRIRLRRFWLRRAARLLPAALTVIATVALLAPIILPVIDRDGTAVQQLSSIFLVQNWALVFQAVDYLSAGAAPTALEHFWSLSTEEQFYALWPAALVGVAAAARVLRIDRRRVRAAVLVLAAGSFLLSIWLTATAPGAAYFNTGVRAWEFLGGAVLCFLPQPPARARLPLALLGTALLGVALIVVTPALAFPGWIAAVPVAGAMLVIAAGTPTAGSRLARACGHPIVDYVATRSYAIYLWHWPVLIFAPAVVAGAGQPRPLSATSLLVVLAIAVMLAELTHRLVENRFRAGTR